MPGSFPPGWRLEKGQNESLRWLVSPDFTAAYSDLETSFQEAIPLVESKNRGGVLRISLLDKDFVLRETRKGGLFRNLRGDGFSSPQRFYSEIEASRRLCAANVPTPPVLALRLERLPSGCWRGWLLQSLLEGQTLEQVMRENSKMAFSMAEPCARLVRDMTAAGVAHADFHPANIWVEKMGKLWVLDLDKASLYEGPAPAWRTIAISLRLLRYVEKMREGGCGISRAWDEAFLAALMKGLGSWQGMLYDGYEVQNVLMPMRRWVWALRSGKRG